MKDCSARARLIALDWGTSSLRAILLGDAAKILIDRCDQRDSAVIHEHPTWQGIVC